jgi:hypothetical protein
VAEKQTYPRLPISHWWTLRKKFRQSLPGVVTDSYLATVLDMAENSARANVLPFLKDLGIIDDDGKTGEVAKKWRDDGHYPEVCKAILEKVYPEELRHAVSDVSQRAAAERWFANATGSGATAAKMMTALYMVLLEADPSKQPEQEKGERVKRSERVPAAVKAQPAHPAPAPAPNPAPSHNHPPSSPQVPGININLEIHISADSTTEQIDQIFASMAKHIYRAG